MADSHTCPANPAHTASVRLALPTEATAIAEIQQRAWTDDPDLAVLTNEVSGTDAATAWSEAIMRPPMADFRVLVAVEPDEDGAAEDPYDAFRAELRSLPGKWYVIHSYAGFERKVKANIEQRKNSLEVEEDIYQVEVPMEDVVEIKNGQRKMVNRVRIPGYVLVRMELNEDTWSVVRHTPGVTGFVGNAHNPTPLRFEEAFNMLKSLVQVTEAAPAKATDVNVAAIVGSAHVTGLLED